MSSAPNPSKPLLNRTAVVACSDKKLAELKAGLEALGARVLPFPVIEAREIQDTRLLDQALSSLDEYSWMIFTSAYGVTFFLRRLLDQGVGGKIPKICAIGPATAKAVMEFGYEVALVPEQFVAEGIIQALSEFSGGLASLAGHRILIPRAKEGRDVLPEALRESGALVDVVPCYETVQAELEEGLIETIRASRPDLAVFTSSSAVRNTIDILGAADGTIMLRESVVAALGPITRSTAESFGKSPEIVPKKSTIASLLEEICKYYNRNNSIVDRRQ